jgi:triphosphoribosyl-dephospho-CoA synthetase
MDESEVDEYWERYSALSTREQIHKEGFVWWLCNTNKGVLAHLALWAMALALMIVLLS